MNNYSVLGILMPLSLGEKGRGFRLKIIGNKTLKEADIADLR